MAVLTLKLMSMKTVQRTRIEISNETEMILPSQGVDLHTVLHFQKRLITNGGTGCLLIMFH